MTANKLLFTDCLQLNTYKTGSDDSALDCEQSLIFLCKVTARETQTPSGERILREKADCKQSTQALTCTDDIEIEN